MRGLSWETAAWILLCGDKRSFTVSAGMFKVPSEPIITNVP